MNNAVTRSILRWFHLVLTIPILGVIYQPASETEPYIGGVRFLFAPALILSGYWMYAGAIFAIIGVAAWLGAYRLSGFGAALVSQIVLFIARKIWMIIRERKSKVVAV